MNLHPNSRYIDKKTINNPFNLNNLKAYTTQEADVLRLSRKERFYLFCYMMAAGSSISAAKEHCKLNDKDVKKILSSKTYKMLIKDRKREIKNTLQRVFSAIDDKYITLVDKYMTKLLDDDKIERTSISALANIINSLSHNYKKVAEIETMNNRNKIDLKRYKLEKDTAEFNKMIRSKQLDVTTDGSERDTSIIENFYNILDKLKTPNLYEDDIENKDEQELKDNIVLDISKLSEKELKQYQKDIENRLKQLNDGDIIV